MCGDQGLTSETRLEGLQFAHNPDEKCVDDGGQTPLVIYPLTLLLMM